jgi:stage II sporulation protein D
VTRPRACLLAGACAFAVLLASGLALACASASRAPREAGPTASAPVAAEPAAAPAAPGPAGPAAGGAPAPEPPLPLGDDEGAPADGDTEPPPRWPAAVEDGQVLIRIGLASDLARFDVPCCEGSVTLTLDGGPITLDAPVSVEPAASSVAMPEHRIQVAALRDEHQARELGRSLTERTGWAADARFDAASGLYRVRVGRFGSEAEAQAGQRRLAALGFGSAWPVQEGGELREPALRVRAGERSFRVLGRWLVVQPGAEGTADAGASLPVSTDERSGRFRGRLLLFLNGRGGLNLINELPLEAYLRGVVPRELGPELYPRLEALKAQAVAARTYALRHLGEFGGEGFDLCAEPRCQVYGGMGSEHPLSDQAVAETEGEVLLWGNEVVESLYSATCGGHTEDASVVFPWLDAPYLQGVPCPEAGASRLAGALPRGTRFPGGLTRRLVPSRAPAGPAALEERLEVLARSAGLPPTGDRLRSLERSEVRRYVRSVFDLVLDPSLLVESRADAGTAHGPHPGAARPPVAPAVLRHEREGVVDDQEVEWLVLSLARLLGLLREEGAHFRGLDGGVLTVVADGGSHPPGPPRRIEMPADLAVFAGEAGSLAASDLALLPGDAVTLYWWRDGLAALARDGTAEAPPPDRHPARASRFQHWTRFRSDRELATLVGQRYPGLGFRGLEVMARGSSGRVGRLRLLGDGGRSEVVEGLAVRWVLDLPDTNFEAERLARPGTEAGWRFTGGGWGHGVGMCQLGAYVLAGRGLSYREILEHYYTGVTLGRAVVRSPP